MIDTITHELDLIGLKCPLPALKTAKRLKSLGSGEVLRVVSSDPMAAIDIPNLIRETGDELVTQTEHEGRLLFVIRKNGVQKNGMPAPR